MEEKKRCTENFSAQPRNKIVYINANLHIYPQSSTHLLNNFLSGKKNNEKSSFPSWLGWELFSTPFVVRQFSHWYDKTHKPNIQVIPPTKINWRISLVYLYHVTPKYI